MEHAITRLTKEAARLSGISVKEILSERRHRALARVRFAIMLVAYNMGFTTTDIGQRLGGRDHTTVVYGLRQARKLLAEENVPFVSLVASLHPASTNV